MEKAILYDLIFENRITPSIFTGWRKEGRDRAEWSLSVRTSDKLEDV